MHFSRPEPYTRKWTDCPYSKMITGYFCLFLCFLLLNFSPPPSNSFVHPFTVTGCKGVMLAVRKNEDIGDNVDLLIFVS